MLKGEYSGDDASVNLSDSIDEDEIKEEIEDEIGTEEATSLSRRKKIEPSTGKFFFWVKY